MYVLVDPILIAARLKKKLKRSSEIQQNFQIVWPFQKTLTLWKIKNSFFYCVLPLDELCQLLTSLSMSQRLYDRHNSYAGQCFVLVENVSLHTLKFLLYVPVLMPVRQYILCTAKTAQCSVRIIGALEY